MHDTIDLRLVVRFVALTFGLSWTVALILFVTGIGLGSPVSVIAIVVGYMWAPGTAAIIVVRTAGLPVRRPVGHVRAVAGMIATLACVGHGRLSATRLITTGPMRPWQPAAEAEEG